MVITGSAFVERWYEMHGKKLTSGDERKVKLLAIYGRLNDPSSLTSIKIHLQCIAKNDWPMSGESERQKETQRGYCKSRAIVPACVFSEMKRLGEWEGDNPLSGIRQFKEGDQELAFLYEEGIERLLSACDQSANKDLGVIVRICLAIGAR